jgi:hypothetical protein
MPTVEERYAAATAYVRRAIAVVEGRGVLYSVDPVTGVVEWFAGKTKTEVPRNELGHVEERWWHAKSDEERAKIAREAELLGDRVQETLAGAPQDRQRTNLAHGEKPTSTPPTTYSGEFAAQAGELWDKAGRVVDEAASVGKWLVVGGGIIVGWQLITYLRERGKQRQGGASIERSLNRNLVRMAQGRNGKRAARTVAFEDTELHTWFERDRAHVELRDRRTGGTIVEWWDEDVHQAIEDGFLPSRWNEAAAHRAAFDYAKEMGLLVGRRDAAGTRKAQRYPLQLTKGEIEALFFLRGRYGSAREFLDALEPLDDSADQALGGEFGRGAGPYRFQIRAAAVRKTLRATKGDGGDYGAIPNLRSPSVDWVLSEERRQSP